MLTATYIKSEETPNPQETKKQKTRFRRNSTRNSTPTLLRGISKGSKTKTREQGACKYMRLKTKNSLLLKLEDSFYVEHFILSGNALHKPVTSEISTDTCFATKTRNSKLHR